MADNGRILAILPAFNEEGKVGRVVEKIRRDASVSEIIVVDDASTDNTSGESSLAGATVVRHEINRGVGAAIRTGINYGLENKFEIGVILSSDDQHEPSEIGRVIEPILTGECDFVQGSRRLKGGKVVNDRPFRKVMTQIYSLLMTLATGRKITDATNGFRAFRLDIFRKYPEININQDWLNRYELEPYLLYRVIKISEIRFMEIPITIYYHGERRQFTKMKPFRDWWRIARPLIFLTLRLKK